MTLNSGGSGGIITPIFFIGASSGNLFATLFHLDIASFASLGMVAVLSGCANTPISASIFAIGLFGPKIAPYAVLCCVVSFIMSGHRSVYPSQKLGIRKSASIRVKLMEEIEEITTLDIEPRKGGVIVMLTNAMEYFKDLVRGLREKIYQYIEKRVKNKFYKKYF